MCGILIIKNLAKLASFLRVCMCVYMCAQVYMQVCTCVCESHRAISAIVLRNTAHLSYGMVPSN